MSNYTFICIEGLSVVVLKFNDRDNMVNVKQDRRVKLITTWRVFSHYVHYILYHTKAYKHKSVHNCRCSSFDMTNVPKFSPCGKRFPYEK